MSVLQFPSPSNSNSPASVETDDDDSPADVNYDLIASLEALLHNAQVGRLATLAWVGIDPIDGRTTGWQCITTNDDENDALLAGITRLEREFEKATRAE